MPEIEMVQQMSGRRPDGRFWPPVGGTMEVSDEEARELCATDPHQSHPIAKLVREAPVEDARADERAVETAAPTPVRRARPAPRPATAATESRG